MKAAFSDVWSSKAELFFFEGASAYDFGGMEMHALYAKKWISTLHCTHNNCAWIIAKELCDISVTSGDQKTKFNLSSFSSFLEFIGSRKKFCILFFNDGHWIEFLPALCQACQPQAVFQRTGGNEIFKANLADMSQPYEERLTLWVSNINKHITHLISNSAYTTSRLMTAGISPAIIKQISGGVDCTLLPLQNHKAPHQGIRIGSLCRFVPFKNLTLLIDAVAILMGAGYPVTLLLAGDGPLRESLLTYAANKLPNNHFWLQKLDAAQSLTFLGTLDVYACPSIDLTEPVPGGVFVHSETMGRSILEAICCGVPVVANRSGGVAEFIIEECGVLAKAPTPEAFAQALKEALALAPLHEEMLCTLRAKFSWDFVFKKYEGYLNETFSLPRRCQQVPSLP